MSGVNAEDICVERRKEEEEEEGKLNGVGIDHISKKVNTLILDAGPLITQTADVLQKFADNFITTPGVFSELKDDFAKSQLVLWGSNLKIRQPKPEFIKRVSEFSKLTGDYSVLSINDIHIIALAYELEYELNNGDWRLRKYPGEKKIFPQKIAADAETAIAAGVETSPVDKVLSKDDEEDEDSSKTGEWTSVSQKIGTGEGKQKKKRRGGKKQREKREAREVESLSVSLEPEFNEEDDDGDWITLENLQEEMIKDSNEKIEKETSTTGKIKIKVALTTGDFACQNVSLQIGLNLMNSMSGLRIKRVRNYMFRCHACFRLTPLPKDGKPKHFCPYCGGSTLLRCAVSIDSKTGEITPHLKKNFEWHKRGDKYSLPSPLSKNSIKKYGNSGFQHQQNKNNKQEIILLNEDQKEYQQALKNDLWQRKQNEKLLAEWIGGGSADNYVSPFTSQQDIRPTGVRVGRSKFVNSTKKKC
ncbi:hypothetical protein PACTADRAFT_4696 [Pachysolen tannophilus NRRL Y-2460]|uniref:20S-pre-rRNA D-site endonuclease NOB1 n=1 Tax=Pachysolen tannophilus NRRL Y-2460 TaxID=669874 RepID=A0A1E4TPV6_PACTA|nr:hypothetical protein PACTADRAFT_4696 [Pachysolen tannophilus NRRL Y-2460]